MFTVDTQNMTMQQTAQPFRFKNLKFAPVTFSCAKHGNITLQTLYGKMPATCPACEKEMQNTRPIHNNFSQDEFIAMNIDTEYKGKTLDQYTPTTPSQQKAKNAIARLIANKQGKIILRGTAGLGKTYLGAMAVMALGGVMYTQYEITTMIKQSYSPRSKITELDIINKLCSTPCLFIDELGRSRNNATELNWLFYVIDKRHTRGLPLIIATNAHSLKDCPQHGCDACFENLLGGNAVASRFKQDTQIITLQGADYRQGHKTLGKIA